jgi:hypothetical protein
VTLQPGPWIEEAAVRVTARAMQDVRLIGTTMEANLTASVSAAPVRATRSGPAQLTLTVVDPDRELVTNGRMLDRDENMLLDDNIDLELGGVWWRLMGVEPADSGWTLSLEDRSGAWHRRHDKPIRAVRGRVNRAAFVWRLYQEAGGGIDLFVPELLDAQRQAKTERPTGSATSTTGGTSDGGASGLSRGWPASTRPTVKGSKATDLQLRNIVGILTECARLNASRRVSIAALMAATQESTMGANAGTTGNDDTGLFQQGRPWISIANVKDPGKCTRAFLLGGRAGVGGTGRGDDPPGWKQKNGSLRAASGSLTERIANVQQPKAQFRGEYAQWEPECTRTVDLWLKAGGPGGASEEKGSGSTTTTTVREKAYEFERGQDGKREDSLACITRLASEVEWRHWIFGNVGVYISDEELITAPVGLRIRRDDRAVIAGPDWKYDVRKNVAGATCEVLVDRLPEPGQVAVLENEGAGSGRWLIDSVDADLAAPVDVAGGGQALRVSLALVRAQKRLVEPAPETESSTTSTSGGRSASGGRASAATTTAGAKAMAVYNRAVEISQQNLSYSWGGGHERAGSPSRHPGSSHGGPIVNGYDCSGYVVACLAAAGWGFRSGGGTATSGGLMAWGKPGRGKHVTVWANSGHVFLEFHGLGRWKSADTQRITNKAGGPHVHTAVSGTSGFTARHWPGE